jgi:hypothetical protein
MTFFVYVDYTTEEMPRPFYVGKGDVRRLKLTYRNRLHDNISKKHGVDRRVVLETENETEAFEHECSLIAEHRTYVYGEGYVFGANFTVGGEGCSGRQNSLETRVKMGLGRKGKKHTDEARKQMSRVRKGRKITEAHRLNIQRASTGRKHTPETKARLSELARLQHARQRQVRETE